MKKFKTEIIQFKKIFTVEHTLKSIVIIGSIIALFMLFKIILPLYTGQNLAVSKFGNNLPIKNPNNYVLVIKINDTQELGKINIELLTIIVPANSSKNPRCIKNIVFDEFYPERLDLFSLPDDNITDLLDNKLVIYNDYYQNPYSNELSFHQLCFDSSMSTTQEIFLSNYEETHSLNRNININVASDFYFPIDERYIQTFVWIEFEDGSRVAPQIVGLIGTSPDWDKRVDSRYIENHLRGPATLMEILYFRPLGIIVLSIIVLLSLLIFIIALLFIEEGSFWEVSVGILLGLWGAQNILVPQNISGQNLIHTTVITYYALFAVVVILRLLARPIWTGYKKK